MIYGVQG